MTPECCSDELDDWLYAGAGVEEGDIFVCPKCFTHYYLATDGWWTSIHGECGVDPRS